MPHGFKAGGRQKGSLNKSTLEIKALAQKYGPDAIKQLANLMLNAENDQAKIAACKELLDRGYGKSVQSIEASGVGGKALVFTWKK